MRRESKAADEAPASSAPRLASTAGRSGGMPSHAREGDADDSDVGDTAPVSPKLLRARSRSSTSSVRSAYLLAPRVYESLS